MIDILLVEDNESAVLVIQNLLKIIEKERKLFFNLKTAKDFDKAREYAEEGDSSIALIDLQIPVPSATAEDYLSEYPGNDIIDITRKYNKDTVISLFTAHEDVAKLALLSGRVDYMMFKTEGIKSLKKKFNELCDETLRRFNFFMNTGASDALTSAFRGNIPWGNDKQWGLCLRRLLRSAKTGVIYDVMPQGRSGSGIVSAYVDERLPKVLKFDQYSKLLEELRRYNDYVKDYIPKRAITSREDLSHAGEVGIISYSFIGMASTPTTLAEVIMHQTIDKISGAIQSHFTRNCEYWFAQNGVPKPYDLATSCREHFKVKKEIVKNIAEMTSVKVAIQRAAEIIEECSADQLIYKIGAAIGAKRRNVSCRPLATVHGDLNVGNLIWDENELWMIDFAKTGPNLRIIDFVKLEASLKYDVETDFKVALSDNDKIASLITFENSLLDKYLPISQNLYDGLNKKASAIGAVRSCAKDQMGKDGELEYWLALFFVTVKHIEYLSEDIINKRELYVPLVHALVSAYRLSKMTTSTIVK